MKYCLYCKEKHPKKHFNKNTQSKDGYRHRCKKYYSQKNDIRRKTSIKIIQLIAAIDAEKAVHKKTKEKLESTKRKIIMIETELKRWKTKYEIIMSELGEKGVIM